MHFFCANFSDLKVRLASAYSNDILLFIYCCKSDMTFLANLQIIELDGVGVKDFLPLLF